LVQERWLKLAQRLHALASTGLHFGAHDYDKERYAEIGDIATQMLADLGGVEVARIEGLVPGYGKGYATPLIDVRAAVFRDDQILLVHERTDDLWTLPGGYADVGLSAAENIVKEVKEEANLDVRAARLFCVRHKAKHPYNLDVRDFYKLFFLCERATDDEPRPGMETQGAGYFSLDDLPRLSQGRVIEDDIRLAFEYRLDPARAALFD
jgi:ADP-ribose pyrophosphatase YjhB (NUDIX family)